MFARIFKAFKSFAVKLQNGIFYEMIFGYDK